MNEFEISCLKITLEQLRNENKQLVNSGDTEINQNKFNSNLQKIFQIEELLLTA